MKPTVWLASFAVLLGCNERPPTARPIASGTYIGLESMGLSHHDLTPDDTTDRWYHENTLTIRGNSAFLHKAPVVFQGKQKNYSASDGGFYDFRGQIRHYPDSLVANLLLVGHDYALVPYRLVKPADTPSSLSFEEKVKRGTYALDSSFFKKSYQIAVYPDHLVMDSVKYYLKQSAPPDSL